MRLHHFLSIFFLSFLCLFSSCHSFRYRFSDHVQTSALYAPNAKVNGLETVVPGDFTVFRYSSKRGNHRVAHRTQATVIFLQALRPETWPLGKRVVASDSTFMISGFQYGGGMFAHDFPDITGTLTPISLDSNTYHVRLRVHYTDRNHKRQSLSRTVAFQLDSTLLENKTR